MSDIPGAAPAGDSGSPADRSAPSAPQLPASLLDPRPVVAVGFVAWLVATLVFLAADGPSADALPTCYAGLVIGALGTVVFLVQRRAARSGRKGAQRGLR